MSAETALCVDALRRILDACRTPFGKDARKARRIAKDALERLGVKE